MSDISFFHIASVYPKATKFVVENVRKYHPNNFYHLCVDGTDNYSYLAEEYNLDYRYYTQKIGGPVSPYGYDLDRVLSFLFRFKQACERCNTSHIMMLEDDVLLIKPVTVRNVHIQGHQITHGNKIPENILHLIEISSGKKPNVDYYSAGGGTIFDVEIFLQNYYKVVSFFESHFISLQSQYPTIGYIDCFMVIYYLLCGSDYDINSNMTDTHNHQPGFDYNSFINNLNSNIEIVNNYKKFYYE